jgi:hypothetical protein
LGWFGLMVFNDTFNNISVLFWQSVLLVEETFYWWRKPDYPEKTTDQSQVTDKHNVVHLALIEIRTHNISGDRH